MNWQLGEYSVRVLTEESIEEIYHLCRKNSLYYSYCPPMVTKESIAKDLVALPPNKTLKDKFFLGFYQQNSLIAVMDLILRYPKEDTAFIGFFMVDKDYQHQGLGTRLIQTISDGLRGKGYQKIRLCYVKNNPQAKAFWYKNDFLEVGLEIDQKLYIIRVLEKAL